MPKGGTRQIPETREIKRNAILRAATEVFAEKGYFAARMSDVAHHAGVADGTLYLYFEGKEHLLVSIFDDSLAEFTERVEQRIAGLDDPRAQLETMLRLHLEALAGDRQLAHVMQIETRHSRRFMSLFTHGRLAAYLALLRGIIEEGQARGDFRRDVGPGLATKVVFGAVDELVTSWLLAKEPGELERDLPRLMDFLIHGLAPEAPGTTAAHTR